MDAPHITDNERGRLQDMIEHMSHAVMNYHNKRIAFLTFKIVEETIKRAVLRATIEKLMPVNNLAILAISKAMDESTVIFSESLTNQTQ